MSGDVLPSVAAVTLDLPVSDTVSDTAAGPLAAGPPAVPGEAETVAAARAGDRAAFGRLLAAHYDRLFRVALRLMGDRAEAEDLTQAACVKLAQVMRSFRGEAPFGAFAVQVTINLGRDRLRARGRSAKLLAFDPDAAALRPDPAPGPERAAAAADLLRRALAALSPAEREAVILVHGEGLSHGEAAKLLGVADVTISWRLMQARRRLGRLFGRLDDPAVPEGAGSAAALDD